MKSVRPPIPFTKLFHKKSFFSRMMASLSDSLRSVAVQLLLLHSLCCVKTYFSARKSLNICCTTCIRFAKETWSSITAKQRKRINPPQNIANVRTPSLKNVQTRPLFRHGPAPLSVPAPHCSAQDVPLKLYRPLNCIEFCSS